MRPQNIDEERFAVEIHYEEQIEGRHILVVERNPPKLRHSYFCCYVETNGEIDADRLTAAVGHVEITYGPDDDGWVGWDSHHPGQHDMTPEEAYAETARLAGIIEAIETATNRES